MRELVSHKLAYELYLEGDSEHRRVSAGARVGDDQICTLKTSFWLWFKNVPKGQVCVQG